jgi:hypothetical protein
MPGAAGASSNVTQENPAGPLLPSGRWIVRNAKNLPTPGQGVVEQIPSEAARLSVEHDNSRVKYGCGPLAMSLAAGEQPSLRPWRPSLTRFPSPAMLLLMKPPVHSSASALGASVATDARATAMDAKATTALVLRDLTLHPGIQSLGLGANRLSRTASTVRTGRDRCPWVPPELTCGLPFRFEVARIGNPRLLTKASRLLDWLSELGLR